MGAIRPGRVLQMIVWRIGFMTGSSRFACDTKTRGLSCMFDPRSFCLQIVPEANRTSSSGLCSDRFSLGDAVRLPKNGDTDERG